ncbi:hypothetical protein NO932_04225 [Pelagibacterium sp. 26DY04]|nr:hypothetical protein [Pelagibacterium sp. 26DY04]WMT87818.1 hypothetical protein NO932_04225 [Pelagibacterium sp. 26DY04]
MAIVILGVVGAVVVLAAAVTGLLMSTEAEVERATDTHPHA